jgi:myo-inositol-1(or 4)-monophosphatase
MELDDALLAQIEAHAVEMARNAGAILLKHFGRSLSVEYKDKRQRDPVTNADKESQEYLKQAISQCFPGHSVLGEEDKEDDSPAPDFTWVLDPLDGTRNYMSGLPVFACSIGVMHRGAPIVGAVFVPWPRDGGGVVLHARRGGGAFIGQERLAVFQAEEPKGSAIVGVPGYFQRTYHFKKPMRGKVGEVRVTGSTAYELAMTARGTLQYAISSAPHLWDVAAGVVLVAEAGGLVMRGIRPQGLRSLWAAVRWEPMESLVPAWQGGVTTMKELRGWTVPLVLGSPGIVRYLTANMRAIPPLEFRIRRLTRRMKPRRKGK